MSDDYIKQTDIQSAVQGSSDEEDYDELNETTVFDREPQSCLEKVGFAYSKQQDNMEQFHWSWGHQVRSFDYYKNNSTLIYGNKRKIKMKNNVYDEEEEETEVYSNDEVQGKGYWTRIRVNGDLVYIANQIKIVALDLKNEFKEVASLKVSAIDSHVDAFFVKMELIEDGTVLLALRYSGLYKLSIEDKSMIVPLQSFVSNNVSEEYFTDLQLLEDSVLLSQQSIAETGHYSNDIFELSLDDLSKLRQLNRQPMFRFENFYYAEQNGKLFCKDFSGATMRVYESSSGADLQITTDKVTLVDVMQTNHFSPFVEYEEKQLLFQGGVEGVCAIDLSTSKVVARFKLDGTVIQMRISDDRKILTIQATAFDTQEKGQKAGAKCNYYNIHLEEPHFEEVDLQEKVQVLCKSKTDNSKIYAVCNQKDLKLMNPETNEMGETIISMEHPITEIYPDYNDEFMFINCTTDEESGRSNLFRVNMSSGETQEIKLQQNITNANGLQVMQLSDTPQSLLAVIRKQRKSTIATFFDCSELNKVSQISHKGEEITSMGFIDATDTILIGTEKGHVAMYDAKSLQALKDAPNNGRVDLFKADSEVKCIHVSPLPEQRYIAVGTDKGTVYVYQNFNQKDKKPLRWAMYNVHTMMIEKLQFINLDDNFLLASTAEDETLNLFCLRERLHLYKNEGIPAGPEQIVYSDDFETMIVKSADHRLFKFDLNFNDQFFLDLQNKVNYSLTHNIKRKFLQSQDQKIREACFGKIEQWNILNFIKINTFSEAVIMGKNEALELAAKKFDMWMTDSGETMIELAERTSDSDCIQICLQKYNSGQGNVNLETVLFAICEPESDDNTMFLKKYQVVKAELDDEVKKLQPFLGQINERYLTSENQIVTKDLIEDAIDTEVPKEEQQKIMIDTFSVPVSMTLGSESCIYYLRTYDTAPISSLQVEQTTMYVEALWQANHKKIKAYAIFNTIPFFVLTFACIFQTKSKPWMAASLAVNVFMLLLESRQLKAQGLEYFKDTWNILDLLGYGGSIAFACMFIMQGFAVYQNDHQKMFLIIGLLTMGIRAISQLRIIGTYRVLIEMIKQTLIDMQPFVFILICIVVLMTIIQTVDDAVNKRNAENLPSMLGPQLGGIYQIIFGENPNGEKMIASQWIIYIILTLVVNVTALNLLVAILSNTFDVIMSNIDALHCKAKVDILNEIQDAMFWNRDNEDLVYLHFVYYANEQISAGVSEEGRVRAILNRLDGLRLSQEQQKRTLQDFQKEFQLSQEDIQDEFREFRITQQKMKDELKADMMGLKTLILTNQKK